MNKIELQKRTKKFHIEVIKLCKGFPKDAVGFETSKQLIRAAGSVGANYRATARAKSKADFSYKISVVLEEADESNYWLEVVRESGIYSGSNLDNLIMESSELTAIFTAVDKTLRSKKN